MPILPPAVAQIYDSVNSVLDVARVRLNDSITAKDATSGRILENNSAFSQALVNTAWRNYQEFIANLGVSPLRQEQVIYGLPAVASLDPSSQVRIDWFNYFDGANLFQAPVLPPDLIFPLWVGERQSGANSAFMPMEDILDGLPNTQKSSRNACWEWRADGLYMPGSLSVMDLRIRYARYLGDFLDNFPNPVQWFQQPVPLMRCSDSFAYFICAEVGDARDDLDGAKFRQAGAAAAKLFVNRDISRKQRTNIRRQSRSGRLEGNGFSNFC